MTDCATFVPWVSVKRDGVITIFGHVTKREAASALWIEFVSKASRAVLGVISVSTRENHSYVGSQRLQSNLLFLSFHCPLPLL